MISPNSCNLSYHPKYAVFPRLMWEHILLYSVLITSAGFNREISQIR